jgi:regulator of extracellular matrix RemA (YlzA/DUF370 family)
MIAAVLTAAMVVAAPDAATMKAGVPHGAVVAAAQLDAAHAAVLGVLTDSPDAGGCEPAALRKIAADASIRKLGRVDGDDVVLASVESPCICGAQNCPSIAIRVTRGKPRELLTVYAIGVRTTGRANPLPDLIADAHDSAMVIDETTYSYRNGTYAIVDSARVRASDHARKPNTLPVRFAPGASSANLHGTVSVGWHDAYMFGASKGQKLLIDGVRSHAKLRLLLFGAKDADFSEVRAGVPFTLPASHTYRLQVENDSEEDVPYTFTLSVR